MRLSSATLAQWYLQLAATLEAGTSLEQALGNLPGPPAAARESWRTRLLAGDSIAASMEKGATWLPEMDRQLIAAGATSARLPEVLRRMSARHEATSRATRLAILAAVYPLVIGHFAALVVPIQMLVSGAGVAAYLEAVLKILLPAWVILALGFVGVRRRWRVAVAVLDLVPLVRGYRRFRALSDLAFTLEAQLVAGIRPDIAWLQAVIAAGDRRLEAIAVGVAETVQQGGAVSPVLAGRRELPKVFVEFYASGEQNGKLDESLAFLQRHFAEAARVRLTAAAFAYPMALFAMIALWVAVQIIRFYTGLWGQYDEFLLK